MDDLLQRVREHLSNGAAPPEESGGGDLLVPAPATDRYAEAVATLALLLRDAGQAREALSVGAINALSREEIDDLLKLLGKVFEELAGCETALHHAAPFE
ncbi:MAG TPA: hypothetical protein VKX16_03790 [Chloroflexota bacterium]|nr:hypothetical protein [Chloroflexota bacterium]